MALLSEKLRLLIKYQTLIESLGEAEITWDHFTGVTGGQSAPMSAEAYAEPLNEASVPSFDNSRDREAFMSETISQRPVVSMPQGSVLRPIVTQGTV